MKDYEKMTITELLYDFLKSNLICETSIQNLERYTNEYNFEPDLEKKEELEERIRYVKYAIEKETCNMENIRTHVCNKYGGATSEAFCLIDYYTGK